MKGEVTDNIFCNVGGLRQIRRIWEHHHCYNDGAGGMLASYPIAPY